MDRLKRLIAGALELVPGRRSATVTFGTSPGRPGPLSPAARARHAQLMNALAMVEHVESSPIVRTVELSGPQHQAHIAELRVHSTGVSGVIDVMAGPEGKLRADIDGMPIEVIGSDGTRFPAVCSGTSADNNGPKVRFVFVPAPTESTTGVSISLSPFSPIGDTSETLVVQASLS